MPEGKEEAISHSQAERQLPQIVETSEGFFLKGRPLYNPNVISNRDPFIESIAPGLVDDADRFVQEHPDQAGSVKDYFRRMGLNPGLVNLKQNK